MMDINIFDSFEFIINIEKVKKKMGLEEEEDLLLIEEYCHTAQKIARPKAAFAVAYLEELGKDHIKIGNVQFNSKLLAENLKETNKVIPYILTCGREIYEWAKGIDGFIEVFIAEQIKIETLSEASKFFHEYIRSNIFPEKSSTMNPGSLEDWPLSEQNKMFELLLEPAKEIGVELTQSCLMIPDKSVSGIVFQKEKSFVNCMLCQRENCSGRQIAYEGDRA
jgi:hypothetical protein